LSLRTLTIYPRNLFNILSDVSIYGVMAVGMTLVILTAGIDLSVGGILAFAAMSAAAVLKGTGESHAIPEDPLAFGGFCLVNRTSGCNRRRIDLRMGAGFCYN
jgi:inositol transport system permease protein